jgi:hypothetical protein
MRLQILVGSLCAALSVSQVALAEQVDGGSGPPPSLAKAVTEETSAAAPAGADGGATLADAGTAPAGAAAVTAPLIPRVLPPIPAGLGRITGRVTLAGLPPKLAAIPVGKDMKTCGTTKVDEALEVGAGGGVKNALLWAPTGPPPVNAAKSRTRLGLLGCQFVPHVVAAPVGSELLVVNDDPVFHNVTATGALVLSYAMPIKGHTVPTKLKKVGVAKLESKSHAWMKATVHILATSAFNISEADGSWYLDLPPGPQTIQLWHERLGEREEKVEIAAGQTLVHDFPLTSR